MSTDIDAILPPSGTYPGGVTVCPSGITQKVDVNIYTTDVMEHFPGGVSGKAVGEMVLADFGPRVGVVSAWALLEGAVPGIASSLVCAMDVRYPLVDVMDVWGLPFGASGV